MRKIVRSILLFVFVITVVGCKQENHEKDRSAADEMFSRIIRLTSNYTSKLAEISDSAEWAKLCNEFEDSLDRINFSYPPDTDLLLTEGQNDTIHSMLQMFIKDRDNKIQEILHPVVLVDSIGMDSLSLQDSTEGDVKTQADASRNLDN